MFVVRKTYHICPDHYDQFIDFFYTFLVPDQLKHGAECIGIWENDGRNQFMSMWSYPTKEVYETIEELVQQNINHQKVNSTYVEKVDVDTWISTSFPLPKHYVSVTGYITNQKGEVLFVKNVHRNDTYELPGGVVEPGETLMEALKREVLEETGVHIKVEGISAIYQNVTKNVFCVTFFGKYLSGELRTHDGETMDVRFVKIDESNIDQWVTRPHLKKRVLDAYRKKGVTYTAYQLRPFQLLEHWFTSDDEK